MTMKTNEAYLQVHICISWWSNLRSFFQTTCIVIVLWCYPQEAHNFANSYHMKRVTLFSIPQRQTHKHLQHAFCTQLYTKPNRSVEFLSHSVRKHEHSLQLQQNFISVCLFWQTSKLGFKNQPSMLLQCLAVSGNLAEWLPVQSFAKCKLHSC